MERFSTYFNYANKRIFSFIETNLSTRIELSFERNPLEHKVLKAVTLSWNISSFPPFQYPENVRQIVKKYENKNSSINALFDYHKHEMKED